MYVDVGLNMGSDVREESAGQIIRTWGTMAREQITPKNEELPNLSLVTFYYKVKVRLFLYRPRVP